MKEQILKLREEGKTYNEIQSILGCSKGTISYHLGDNQKEKTLNRTRKRRKDDLILSKVNSFKEKNRGRVRDFQRRNNGHLNNKQEFNFTTIDVLKKIKNLKCYLTGKSINLLDSKSFAFDHIIPSSKGGLNTLDNLGLTDSTINKMKHDLSVDEFINKCKEVLEYQGYNIRKKVNLPG